MKHVDLFALSESTRDAEPVKRWLRVASIGCAALALAVPAWNVLLDPHEVFGTGLFRYAADPNERLLKIEHLTEMKGRGEPLNALVIGASTAGAFRITDLEAAFSGHRFYNLAMRSANLREIEQVLTFVHGHLYQLEVVVMTVDLFQLVEPPKRGGFMTMHPAVGSENLIEFWWSQMWASTLLGGAGKLLANVRGQSAIAVDFATGEYHYAERGYAGQRSGLGTRRDGPMVVPRADALQALEDIAAWCVRHRVELHLLPTPRLPAGNQLDVSRVLRDRARLAQLLRLPPPANEQDFVDDVHFNSQFAGRWLSYAFDSMPKHQSPMAK